MNLKPCVFALLFLAAQPISAGGRDLKASLNQLRGLPSQTVLQQLEPHIEEIEFSLSESEFECDDSSEHASPMSLSESFDSEQSKTRVFPAKQSEDNPIKIGRASCRERV